jgi:hypothetical protein
MRSFQPVLLLPLLFCAQWTVANTILGEDSDGNAKKRRRKAMEFKTGINRQTSASSLYAYASLYKHAKRNDRAGVVTFEEKGRAFGRRQCWRKVAELHSLLSCVFLFVLLSFPYLRCLIEMSTCYDAWQLKS